MMEIDEEDILRSVAAGGSMDYSVWPALLPSIVSRIEKIAHDEFPIPQLPPPLAAPAVLPSSSIPHHPAAQSDSDAESFLPPIPSSPTNPPSTTSSQETNKENTPLAPRAVPPPTSVPAPVPLPPGTLPPQATAFLTEITGTLTATFPTYPPHTIQRLAELVLTPKHHYKSLPTYLHALDRVVHVTSGLNVYPLPPAVPDVSTVGLLSNGASDTLAPSPWASPGSDEALGGALLTPIPWLQHGSQAQAISPQSQSQPDTPTSSERSNSSNDAEGELRTESTETIDGPNGMGSIETVTVTLNGVPSMGARGVGVTQGELLRQEQRAGVVPVSQLVPSHHSHHHPPSQQHPTQRAGQAGNASGESASAAEQADDDEEVAGTVMGMDEDEKPHARGPEEIGPEDMGPQKETTTSANYVGGPGVEMQGIDVEAAVGRKASDSCSASPPEPKPADEDKDVKSEDKMEGVETSSARSSTPKREAEDELEGVSKKLREDPGADPEETTGEDADIKADDEDEKKEESKPATDD